MWCTKLSYVVYLVILCSVLAIVCCVHILERHSYTRYLSSLQANMQGVLGRVVKVHKRQREKVHHSYTTAVYITTCTQRLQHDARVPITHAFFITTDDL